MVFVSIGLRFRVEAEAMNMVEPLGAYTRHRVVYALKHVRRKQGDKTTLGYRAVPVPAISGQSVANAYSRVLVDLAKLTLGDKAPLCDECRDYLKYGGFIKRSGKRSMSHDDRVKECIVEDITGFLVAAEEEERAERTAKRGERAERAELPRRTSAIWFSYMIPDVDYGAGAIESQFHVQYNFETQQHRPFTIESGSAVYMQLVALDVDQIGRLKNGDYVSDRLGRIKLAFKALLALYEGHVYGAKKSRYLPLSEILGGVAAVSSTLPFMVSKPKLYYGDKTYIEDTIDRARKFVKALEDLLKQSKEDLTSSSELGGKVKLYITYFDREGVLKREDVLKTEPEGSEHLEVESSESYIDMINKVLNKVLSHLQQEASK
jgi:CRISPR-associated protein Csa2